MKYFAGWSVVAIGIVVGVTDPDELLAAVLIAGVGLILMGGRGR